VRIGFPSASVLAATLVMLVMSIVCAPAARSQSKSECIWPEDGSKTSLPESPTVHSDRSRSHAVLRFLGHLAIGAGTEVAVSQVAGGAQKWPSGIVATGAVAGFKEGADAQAGRDTRKQAVWHALTILAGAGIAAAIKH